jgi:hypothetical protein
VPTTPYWRSPTVTLCHCPTNSGTIDPVFYIPLPYHPTASLAYCKLLHCLYCLTACPRIPLLKPLPDSPTVTLPPPLPNFGIPHCLIIPAPHDSYPPLPHYLLQRYSTKILFHCLTVSLYVPRCLLPDCPISKLAQCATAQLSSCLIVPLFPPTVTLTHFLIPLLSHSSND